MFAIGSQNSPSHEIELFIQNNFKALKFNKTVIEKNENWTESECVF